MTRTSPGNSPPARTAPRWVGPVVFLLAAAVVALLGLLATSIMERRWEAQRPSLVLQPIAEWEPDNAVWGRNYPREYESYLATRQADTRTKFGGAFQRDYLDEDPNLVILFSGYPFSKEYRQARGHYYSVTDVTATRRVGPATLGSCWTCKSTDVPRVMNQVGVKEFYATTFADLKDKITHPIGCQDCHDPKTMNLRITRPALREAYAARGKNIDEATHQEMRSLVCAQCHVEYYFKDKSYVTLPWAKGMAVEDMLTYYDESNFTDYTHAVSKTPILKAQHPDYELWSTGIHAYRGVACADCHMPYRSEGGVKFTNHHVRSPLLDIASSCSVCHRWSEQEARTRVEEIQTKVEHGRRTAEQALTRAHFDVAAAMEAGVAEEALAAPRKLIRHAQFRWDYVAASNGMGFHSPQEAMRILEDAVNQAQEARVLVARLLAAKGVSAEPKYPDLSTRAKAAEASGGFVEHKPPKLLP